MIKKIIGKKYLSFEPAVYYIYYDILCDFMHVLLYGISNIYFMLIIFLCDSLQIVYYRITVNCGSKYLSFVQVEIKVFSFRTLTIACRFQQWDD